MFKLYIVVLIHIDIIFAFLSSQADQLKESAHHQDDSDLEKKRRETEALLQSMGITSETTVGMFLWLLWLMVMYCCRIFFQDTTLSYLALSTFTITTENEGIFVKHCSFSKFFFFFFSLKFNKY